jgi:hypothetical protein
MSFLGERNDLDFSVGAGAISGEAATLGEVYRTAYEDWRLNAGRVEFNKRAEQIYDREIDRLKQLGGVDLVNPFRYSEAEMQRGNREGLLGSSFERFEQHRQRLAETRPDLADEINAGWHTLGELYWEQQAAEKRAEQAVSTSPYTVNMWLLGKLNPAALAGGFVASLTDPIGIAQNFAGPGGRTALGAKAVIWQGLKAGAANAGASAAVAPLVQEWRKQAGLDYGLHRVGEEMAGAALIGFGLDVGVRTAYRGAQRGLGRDPVLNDKGEVIGYRGGGEIAPPPAMNDPLQALDDAAQTAPEGSPLRQAADLDDAALTTLAKESGAAEADPAVRGALAELEHYRAWGDAPEVPDAEKWLRLAQAIERASDPAALPPGEAFKVRPAVDEAALDAGGRTALNALRDQVGTPIELAGLIRQRADLIDVSVPVSDRKMRTALALARLSDEAYAKVEAGLIDPNHAAIVGDRVVDRAEHAALIDAVAGAKLRSKRQVELMLGELTAKPGHQAAFAALQGTGAPARELVAERVKVLDAGVKSLLADRRIADLIEAEAGRIEAALPEAERGSKAARAGVGERIGRLVEELALVDGPVSDLLHEAAQAMASGTGQRAAARAFAGRLADLVERDGIESLARPRERSPQTLKASGFDDPFGPEAQAQVTDLANRIKFALPDGDGNGRGRRQGGAAAVRRSEGVSPAQRADAADGGTAAGGEPRAAGRAGGRRDAGPEGRPVGEVGNFSVGSDFTGTVIATRTAEGLNKREYWLHKPGASLPSGKASAATVNRMLTQMGNWVANIDIVEKRPGVWEVGMVKVDRRHRRQHIATRLYDAIEAEIGGRIEASGYLMPNGYDFWARRNPELIKHHRFVPGEEMWLSPKRLMEDIEILDRTLRRGKLSTQDVIDMAVERKLKLDLLATVPDEAKTPEALANSFSLRDPVEPAPRAAADWPEILAEVDRVIERLPAGVRARVEQRLVFGQYEPDGMWNPREKLIQIAFNERAGRTARHEEIEALRHMSLITDDEWDVLVARARRDGLREAYAIDRRYADEIAHAKETAGDAAAEALAWKETVADMWGDWRRGVRFGPAIDRVFRFLSDTLERIRNALSGRGFQAAADVFRRVETGAIARRSEIVLRQPAGDLPQFALKPVAHDKRFDHLRDWLGIDPHRMVIDAEHIADKRKAHNATAGHEWRGNRLETPHEVLTFVRDALANSSFAVKYKIGSSWTLRLALDDGSYASVSIDASQNKRGEHMIRTAYPATHDDHIRQIVGAVGQYGDLALKMRGDPAGLEHLFANVSEAHRTAPGRVPDTVVEVVRQQMDRARELAAKLKQPEIREAFESAAGAAVKAELEQMEIAARPGQRIDADARRAQDLGTFAEHCKT